MGKKTTQEEFVNKLKDILPDISVIGEYSTARLPIECRCEKCGYEWSPLPTNLLRGHGCPRCVGHLQKTHEQFVKEVEAIGKVTVLGKYKNAHSPVLVKCNKCGKEWAPHASNLLNGIGCKSCCYEIVGKKNSISDDVFIKRVSNINPTIKIHSTYSDGPRKRANCTCSVCGFSWVPEAHHLIEGHGCPQCSVPSVGEHEIQNVLDTYNIEYIRAYRFDELRGVGGKCLSYDFYLPKHNLLIEYQGQQHYEPVNYFGGEDKFKIQQEHDKRKRDFALSRNIRLIEIRYDEDTKNTLIKHLDLEPLTTAGAAQ